ncbi:MAG TPA: type II secretion system protein N, partial [Candidatus Competibacteraceae bacterium]|nr:type II secretion system protein N [Candidatus Competibacteraceae bacterium]
LPLGRAVSLAGSPPPPLDGSLELNLAELHLDAAGRPLTARGSVRLLDAHSRFGQPLTLGSFVAHSAGDGPPLAAEVRDEGGPVELSGRVQLAADGRYRFDGRLGLRGSADPALHQALELLLGPPATDGRWPLDLAGTLAL